MNDKYPFKLIPLNYEYSSLEPYIDEKTMILHHDKHLQTYIDNLNKELENYPMYHDWYLPTFLCNIASLPQNIQTSIRNNAGGVYNHNLFFDILINDKSKNTPSEFMENMIKKDFGDYKSFKESFTKHALENFGSGYTWLVINRNGNLQIISAPNQNSTLELNLYPILLIDVWEHAYYLKYNNRRRDYIDNFFNIINWSKVEELYNKYFKKR